MGDLFARWTYSLYNSQSEFGNSFQLILQLGDLCRSHLLAFTSHLDLQLSFVIPSTEYVRINAEQCQASNQTIKTIKTWSSPWGKTREVPHLHNVDHGRIHSHIFSAVPHLPVSQQFYPDSGVLPEPCFSLCRSNRHIRGLFPRQIEKQRLIVLRLVLLLFLSWRSLGQTHRRRGYTSSHHNRPRRRRHK